MDTHNDSGTGGGNENGAINDEVEKIWETLVGDYFVLAADKLSKLVPGPDLKNDDDQEKFDDAHVKLTVHFLFPDLSDQEREVLESISHTRRTLQFAVSVLRCHRQKLGPDEVRKIEHKTMCYEQVFSMFRETLHLTGIYDKLTPTQQEIVNRYFLRISFDGK
jgi:hypothetical protein